MAYLRLALRKNWFINSSKEHFKKNHENAKYIDFQFHNPKLSQQVIKEFHVTKATAICMKEVIDSSLSRAL